MKIAVLVFSVFGLALEASTYIEAKLGYYNFYDKTLRNVYKNGGLDYQLSGAVELNKNLNVFNSIEYVCRHGNSLNLHQKTEFRLVAYSLGPEFNFRKQASIKARLSVGPKFFHVNINNHSPFVPSHCTKNIFGGFVELSLDKTFSNHVFVSAFGNSSFGSIKTKGERTSINSYTAGGGIGYKF